MCRLFGHQQNSVHQLDTTVCSQNGQVLIGCLALTNTRGGMLLYLTHENIV